MMTKIYFRISLMGAMLIALVAPSAASAQVSVGLKAGYTAANLRGDDAGNMEWRSGFAGGIFMSIPLVEVFAIQPELLFRQRGAYNRFEIANIEQRINLTYIDMPILFKLRVPIDKKVYPHLYAGPQVSYSLKGEYEIDLYNGSTFSDQIDIRKVDFGGVIGFGVDIVTEKIFLTSDIRYGLGALRVDGSNDPMDLKNKDISIMVGIGVNISSKED